MGLLHTPRLGSGSYGIYGARGADRVELDSIVSLLHMDGSNGGTTFTDVMGNTWTRSGVTTSTTQKKFGTASLLGGAGSAYYLRTHPGLMDFRTDDFTIDFWVYMSNTQNQQYFFDCALDSSNMFFLKINDYGGGDTRYRGKLWWYYTVGASNILALSTAQDDLTTGGWRHIALVRYNGSIYIFIDGVQKASGSCTSLIVPHNGYFHLGYSSTNTSKTLYGYMDEFRITRGTALWTGAFTPPAAAYG